MGAPKSAIDRVCPPHWGYRHLGPLGPPDTMTFPERHPTSVPTRNEKAGERSNGSDAHDPREFVCRYPNGLREYASKFSVDPSPRWIKSKGLTIRR